MKTTIDLPFTYRPPPDVGSVTNRLALFPDDIKNKVIADHIWSVILNDDELERARSRLSIHEIRRIVQHCLDALA